MASQDSWSGWIVFAGFVIVIVGAMDVLQGFVGILEDEYVVATAKGLAIVDVTAWGWMTLLWGGLLILAGLALLGGAGWARWLAIIAVAVNAIQQIAFLANYPQAYPLWNILIVTLNILVLYALTARWQGFKQSTAQTEDIGPDRGGCCRAPSIRQPQTSVTTSRSGRDERPERVGAERYEGSLWRVSIRSSRALI